jgi:drug/metabolite transporter (DMT)-like permease
LLLFGGMVAVAFLWAICFPFIVVGLPAAPPLYFAAVRALMAGLLLVVLAALSGQWRWPSRTELGQLALIGLSFTAIGFGGMFLGAGNLPTGIATVLANVQPLIAALLAFWFLKEPMTGRMVAGLLIGFAGVVILTNRGTPTAGADLLPQLALLGAAASYAAGAVYSRRNIVGLRPMVPAVVQVSFALVISSGLALIFEQPFALRPDGVAIGSVLWLGLLGSGLAYLAFFRLLKTLGATRTSMVAYVMPVVGIALGAIVASEPISLAMIVGTILVIGGIALVNARIGQRRLFAERRTPEQRPTA